jgi:hypothetical protein
MGGRLLALFALTSVCVLCGSTAQAGLMSTWNFDDGTLNANPNGFGATLTTTPSPATFISSGTFNSSPYSLSVSSGGSLTITLSPPTGSLGGPDALNYYALNQNSASLANIQWAYSVNGGSYATLGSSVTPGSTWTYEQVDLSSMNLSGATSLSFMATVSGGSGVYFDDINLAAPEPVNVALGIFGGVFVVVIVARSRPVRNRVHSWRVAVVHWIDAV